MSNSQNQTTNIDKSNNLVYSAKDSIIYDVQNNQIFLYNNAKVDYNSTSLSSGFIHINISQNEIIAKGIFDSINTYIQKPILTEKEKTYHADTIVYNYKSKKAKINKLITEEEGGYLHGTEIKKETEKIYYLKNGKYTTCSLEEPHFYINAQKLKLIPNEKIITGPANLVVNNIPSPLFIPFGIFPINNQQASGIILPTYGESINLGYNIRNLGYHFNINKYINLSVTTDLYSRGSWRLGMLSTYKKRYKFDGNFKVHFAKTKIGEIERPDYSVSKDFKITWTHTQNAKAHPNNQFSASVNIGTSSYLRNNSYNSDYLTNTLASNISFLRKWDNFPANLSLHFRHNQNTLNKQIDLTLPELSFTVNRVFPFKNIIKKRWYKNMGISYSLKSKNTLSRPDSLLFVQIPSNLKSGVQHSIPISTSFNLLKYINISPSIRYNENWFFKKNQEELGDTLSGFWATRDFNLTTQISTKIYGFFSIKKHNFRHVFTPSISYTYKPDLTKNYFQDLIGVYSNSTGFKQNRLNFNINNNIEMKTLKNNEIKKNKIIDNLSFNFYYDNTLEEFQLSPLDINLRTKLFNKIDFRSRSRIDPYKIDENGTRINQFLWKNGHWGRMTNFNFDISIDLKNPKKETKKSNNINQEELDYINQNINQYIDFSVPWSAKFYYNFEYSKPGIDYETLQSINFNGDLSITQKWKIGFRSGYDLQNKDFTYTSIDIYRDLHCWEMTFNWIPIGFHQSYNFVIRVKSSILQDLKLTKKRDFYDY